MMVRQLFITEALASFRRLERIVHGLTLEEVMACLELEHATRRRQSVTAKLITRAAQLEGLLTLKRLQEKFNGTRT